MIKNDERRQFWRAAFHSPVRVTLHDGTTYARLVDISLKGALLDVAASWQGKLGDECQLRLDLAPGTIITMWTTVVHVDKSSVGLRCDSIDLDSVTHLRRLVELNSGDPALLERELAAMVSS